MGKSSECVLMVLVLLCFLGMACLGDVPLVSEHDGLASQKTYTASPPTVSMAVSTSQTCDPPSRHGEQTHQSRISLDIGNYKAAAASVQQKHSLDMKDKAEKKLTKRAEPRTSMNKGDSSTTPDTAIYSANYQLGDVMDDDVVASQDNNVTTTEPDGPLTHTHAGEDTTTVDYGHGSEQETATPAVTEQGSTTAGFKYQQVRENDWWVSLIILGVVTFVVMVGGCLWLCLVEGQRRRALDPTDWRDIPMQQAWV